VRLRLLVAALAALSAAPAAGAYRNPTPGAVLAYQVPGMHRVQVRRDVVYRRVAGVKLRLDVYRPRKARRAQRLPAVLLGGPPAFGADKRSGQKIGWGQLIAASGLAAVVFDTRSDGLMETPEAPSTDVAAAIRYVTSHAGRLGIDGKRLCTLGFSFGTAPWHLWAAMRAPPPSVRCNVSYYGPLDLRDVAGRFNLSPSTVEEYSAITYLRRDGAQIAPMLVVKAGQDANAGINSSIDRFVAEAQRVGADIRLLTHENGEHGFDTGRRTARTRAIIKQTLAFLRARLRFRLRETCVTQAERTHALGFRTSDGVRLVGVFLGSGPRAVILAHQGNSDLCIWIPYARALAARGYHVLVFDHRGFGSSGRPSGSTSWDRVDLDMLAAIGAARARGATTVVLGGASLGAAAALSATPLAVPGVNGVISLSSPARFEGLDLLQAVRAFQTPALFVAEEGDSPFAEEARQLYGACSSTDKRLAIYPGFDHGVAVLQNAAALATVDAFIAAQSGG
jgi:alpha-beta hydrolase superfamily lysophospholipase